MSFSGRGSGGRFTRGYSNARGSSGRGFSRGRQGFSDRGARGFRGRGGFQPGRGRRDDWSAGFEGRGRSPKRDDRFGGHTQDSDQSHRTAFAARVPVKEDADDVMSRPIIGGEGFSKLPERKPSKMGRIIIRNLPFTTKEDDLKDLMGKCGKIMEVKIPLKDDGKMRGFAFVQFQSINSAETAIKMFNASKLKERPIAVDWAVAKSRYDEALAARESEALFMKQEDVDLKADQEEDHTSESDQEEVSEKNSDASDSEDESEKGDSDAEDPMEEKSEEDDGTEKKKKKPRTPKKPSDVEEGRTLFVRNLPYEETEESLLKLFRKFGVVKYVKVCSHADSGHSKGTGFVQYREKESADGCLSAASSNDGIVVNGRALIVCLAENPKQRRRAEREKHEKPKKDNRNLFLLKEGRLQKDDDPISQNDMRKRSMLDKKKSETLKNLHMFVSTTRLSVHNIPKNIDDAGLREVFIKAAGLRKSSFKESRIIRDLQTLDHTGVGKSRGFGFVEFKNHQDAIKAVAAVNNNATIFKSEKRPIVEFALENKVALQKKQRRLDNSKAKLLSLRRNENPVTKQPAASTVQHPVRTANGFRSKQSVIPSSNQKSPLNGQQPRRQTQNVPQRSPSGPRVPSVSHPRDSRSAPVEPKKKPNKRKRSDTVDEQDDFSRTVEKYKQKLMRTEDENPAKSSRWFDD